MLYTRVTQTHALGPRVLSRLPLLLPISFPKRRGSCCWIIGLSMLVESVVFILCDIFSTSSDFFFFWLTALYLVYGSLWDTGLIVQTTEGENLLFFFLGLGNGELGELG